MMSVVSWSDNLQKKIWKRENLRKSKTNIWCDICWYFLLQLPILIQLNLLLFRQLPQVRKRLEI